MSEFDHDAPSWGACRIFDRLEEEVAGPKQRLRAAKEELADVRLGQLRALTDIDLVELYDYLKTEQEWREQLRNEMVRRFLVRVEG